MKTLVTTWATDINLDLACGRTMDLDVVLGSSLGPVVTMLSSGSIVYPDQHVPLTPYPQWHPGPHIPPWPHEVAQTCDISSLRWSQEPQI